MPAVDKKILREKVDEFNRRAIALWNAGQLEEFCTGYAREAVYISGKNEPVHGREDIFAAYDKEMPDRATMGTLSVEIIDLRVPPLTLLVISCTAQLRWKIVLPSGMELSGYSMIAYEYGASGVHIVQDLST